MILAPRFTFIGERSWKTYIFYTQKGLKNLQFMTSYLVTIETDHHELKMCTRDKQTATGVLSSTKKLRKTSGEWGGGGGGGPHTPCTLPLDPPPVHGQENTGYKSKLCRLQAVLNFWVNQSSPKHSSWSSSCSKNSSQHFNHSRRTKPPYCQWRKPKCDSTIGQLSWMFFHVQY